MENYGCPPIPLGTLPNGQACDIDIASLNNFSTCVIGDSGSGKTYCLRQFVRHYYQRQITPFIIDTQGDINASTLGVDQSDIAEYKVFHGVDGVSLNPFKLDTFMGSGALYTATEDAIDAFRIWRSESPMGAVQIDVLRKLIMLTYEHKGITSKNHHEWHLKEPPLWSDFIQVLRVLVTNAGEEEESLEVADANQEVASDSDSSKPDESEKKEARKSKTELKRLAVLARVNRVIREAANEASMFEEPPEKNDEEIAKTLSGLPGVAEFQQEMQLSMDPDVLERIANIVYEMSQSGMFGNDNLDFRRDKINIYRVNLLVDKGKRVMIRMLLDRLFSWSVRSLSEDQLNNPIPRVILFLDEAKHATVAVGRANLTNSLAKLANEGRKFGVGVFCGAQRSSHINADVRSVSAMNIILPMGVSEVNDTLKTFHVKRPLYEQMRPRSDGLLLLNGQEAKLVHLWRDC